MSNYSRTFRDSGDAVGPTFDYDMDFGIPENSERKLSNSDASSNGQSVAPSALTDTRRIIDGSASHVPTGRYFTQEESQMLRDFTGAPGRMTGAAPVNSAMQSGSSSRGCPLSGDGGFIGERTMREHLPALVTNGLTGQTAMGLNNQGLYAQLSNSSGTCLSEESGSQSAMDSPSLTRALSTQAS